MRKKKLFYNYFKIVFFILILSTLKKIILFNILHFLWIKYSYNILKYNIIYDLFIIYFYLLDF